MIIPHEQISPYALQGLMEEFITREGTDYGETEVSLAHKVRQLRSQLTRGDIVIVFDLASESLSIVTRHDAKLLTQD
jgi:uncharacterized protein YheU (UPF0270 family)